MFATLLPLTTGLLRRGADGRLAQPAGSLSPQPRLRYRGRTSLLDDVVGTGFVLASVIDPRDVLDDERLTFLGDVGAHLLRLRPSGAGDSSDVDAVDVDNVYLPEFTEAGYVAVLVRPDHYVFGAAARPDDLSALVDCLRHGLGATGRTTTGG